MINLLISFILVLIVVVRYLYITNVASKKQRKKNKPARTLIILGSGGHTAEMMTILKRLKKSNYSPRYYILAETDKTSESKVLEIEDPSTSTSDFKIFRIKRSRHVGQSYITSVISTLKSIWQCVPLTFHLKPDLIVCNGPGTCVPICFIAFVYKMLGLFDSSSKIVFVESFCRVETLSLTGKILIWFVDCFVVQWPKLKEYSQKIQYYGRLT